jgi:uncharacterized protein YdiU (UPF0061 family)
LRREFPDITFDASDEEDFARALVDMLREFAKRQAFLVTQWGRVGYVQGNMNSDNCLLAGLTMDYGPFGFMEQYQSLWTPFTSDPAKNFGFENQPSAARDNLINLAEALAPFTFNKSLKRDFSDQVIKIINEDFVEFVRREGEAVKGGKLGIKAYTFDEHHQTLWAPLYDILEDFDYTIFFRELSCLDRKDLHAKDASDLGLVQLLSKASYTPFEKMCPDKIKRLALWLRKYRALLDAEGTDDEERKSAMKRVNPKYVPREWMLKECYQAVEQGDLTLLEALKSVLWNPYEEHDDFSDKFYRTTPEEFRRKPGISFFSCSS